MKFRNVKFLANANAQGNKKSRAVICLMTLLVVSLTLISSISVTISQAVNDYQNDVRAKTFYITPMNGELTDDIINSVKSIDHVVSVDEEIGFRSQSFNILNISENGKTYSDVQNIIDERGSIVDAWSLIGNEKRNVVAGKPLNESPTFSCLVPSLFYPFLDTNLEEKIDDYIDGESLIGKTITIRVPDDEYGYITLYNANGGNKYVYSPAIEFKLNIVGVYYASATADGDPLSIYVSNETAKQIEISELNANSGLNADVKKWMTTPSLRNHYVQVDSYDNMEYVYNKVTEMNIDASDVAELGINPTTPIISNIFSVISIVLIAFTLILSVINIVQSSVNGIMERRGEIGLLKAIGYKNNSIFSFLLYEQILLTLKGFIVGGVISSALVFIMNLINLNGSFFNRMYVINWLCVVAFMICSLVIAVIVPLICQLLTLHKLNKIQPKDAMNDE